MAGALQRLQVDARATAPAHASPARRRFDKLLRQLEQRRAELHAWAEAMPRWRQRHHEQLRPLLDQRMALDLAMIELLDAGDARIKLGKGDRAFLSELVCDLAEPLIAAGREELKPLFDRHSELGYDGEAAESEAIFMHAVGAAFGLDADEIDMLDSPEAVYESVQERLRQEDAHARQRQAQRRARGRQAAAEPPPLRELFRKLAANLHPDRAQDGADAERRTRLMQRLNAAYKANDLIGLIELQAEIGLLDATGVDAWSEERLAQYNRELAQQCKDIERELMQVEMGFCDDYGLQPARSRLKPQQLDKLLAQLKRGLEAELAAMRHDLRMLEQPQAFKRWLKEQRQQERFEQAFDAAGPFR